MRVRALAWLVILAGCASAAPPRAEEPTGAGALAEVPVVRGPRIPEPHACEHARRCCHAYVRAVASVGGGIDVTELEGACSAYGQLPASEGTTDTCKAVMDAFRNALTAMERPVPVACGGPVPGERPGRSS